MTGRPADPLAVLRDALEFSTSIPAAIWEEERLPDALASLAAVERLVEAARHVVYPFDFDPNKPLDEWLGSELIAALAPFKDGEA